MAEALNQDGAQFALIAALLVSLAGAAVAAGLSRLVLGSWLGKGATRSRKWAAGAVFLGAVGPAGVVFQGLLSSQELKIAQGVLGLLLYPPVLGVIGAVVGAAFDRRESRRNASAGITAPSLSASAGDLGGVAGVPVATKPAAANSPASARTNSTAMKRDNSVEDSTPAFDPYDIAGRELQSGLKHPGAWARAVVEADGDPARAEFAYVKLRVATLEAENAARAADAAQEKADQAMRANLNAARVAEIKDISSEEARLRVEALSAMQLHKDARKERLQEVRDFAAYIGIQQRNAPDLLLWNIVKDRDGGFRFAGKYYPWLTGAVTAAQNSA